MSDERKSLNEKLSEELNIKHEETLPIKKEDEIVEIVNNDDIEDDFEEIRKTLKDLEEQGKDATEHLLDLAKEAQTARSFEVVANLLKTTADIAKDRLEIHDKKKKIDYKDNKDNDAGLLIKDSNVVVGTTHDVLKQLKNNKSDEG